MYTKNTDMVTRNCVELKIQRIDERVLGLQPLSWHYVECVIHHERTGCA